MFLGFLVIEVVWKIGTKMVHVCEGAVRYPVGWIKMVTLSCDAQNPRVR